MGRGLRSSRRTMPTGHTMNITLLGCEGAMSIAWVTGRPWTGKPPCVRSSSASPSTSSKGSTRPAREPRPGAGSGVSEFYPGRYQPSATKRFDKSSGPVSVQVGTTAGPLPGQNSSRAPTERYSKTLVILLRACQQTRRLHRSAAGEPTRWCSGVDTGPVPWLIVPVFPTAVSSG